MADWVKSSYSSGQGGECVEWQPSEAVAGSVPVRDSKDTTRPRLTFTPAAWTAFTTSLKREGR